MLSEFERRVESFKRFSSFVTAGVPWSKEKAMAHAEIGADEIDAVEAAIEQQSVSIEDKLLKRLADLDEALFNAQQFNAGNQALNGNIQTYPNGNITDPSENPDRITEADIVPQSQDAALIASGAPPAASTPPGGNTLPETASPAPSPVLDVLSEAHSDIVGMLAHISDRLDTFDENILAVLHRLNDLALPIASTREVVTKPRKRGRKTMSDAEKAAASARMKAYWNKKRDEQASQPANSGDNYTELR